MTTDTILLAYDSTREKYIFFSSRLEQLISDLLRQRNIAVHSVSSRVKAKDSLMQKINTYGQGKYTAIEDVTDIIGVRIITYFADDVDAASKVIEEEFAIDRVNSIDKRKILDPDRFGYLSLHYVTELSNDRAKLMEYSIFSGMKAEIQIRSILQHTWAEIEHDLGYKSKQAIPVEIQRSFSRIAGLLELADDEFIRIRNKLREYEIDVTKKIEEYPENLHIDQASIRSLVSSSQLVKDINKMISEWITGGASFYDNGFDDTVQELQYAGFNNIAEITSELHQYQQLVKDFAKQWAHRNSDFKSVAIGISLFYLCYIRVCKQAKDIVDVFKYLNNANIGRDEERMDSAQRLMNLYVTITGDSQSIS